MPKSPLTVAWISDFPVEWLPEPPDQVRGLPRRHPATWQMVLLSEFEKDPELRIHVILLRRRIERSFSFERNGTQFHILKAPVWLRIGSLFWVDTLLIRRACRIISPALVHAWGAEKGAGLISRRLGRPYVMTVQGLFGWYKERVPLSRYERFAERLERMSLPHAPVVTAESRFAVRFLKERYPDLAVHQAEHAPNRSFFQVQRRPDTAPVHFVSVGTVGLRKGTDLLFQALDQLALEMPFNLTVITSSDQRDFEAMLPFLSETWKQRVTFKHHVLPHEVARELETPTMLLLPTRADTSPNAVKEAVVAGVPVVASDVGGIPDYVTHGKNGFLFPANDLSGFVASIKEACAHPLLGKGLVDAQTLVHARAYLSPEAMARNFLRAYEAGKPL